MQSTNTKHMNAKHMIARHMNAKHMNAKHINAKHINAKHTSVLQQKLRLQSWGVRQCSAAAHSGHHLKLPPRILAWTDYA